MPKPHPAGIQPVRPTRPIIVPILAVCEVTLGAELADFAERACLGLLAMSAHDEVGSAFLLDDTAGRQAACSETALDAETFSSFEADPAARGLCLFACEMCSREDFGAGEAGGPAMFLIPGEGLRFNEEVVHLGVERGVEWVD